MRLLPSRLTRASIALLSLGVVVIHVIDQGGAIGDKAPRYVGVGYWLLELAGLAACALVVVNRRIAYWMTVAVAGFPVVGYVLSRSVGLPAYSDDRGNWGERLGLLSIAVEVSLLVIALATIVGRRRQPSTGDTYHRAAMYDHARRPTTPHATTI
jgi:hypothetical protein